MTAGIDFELIRIFLAGGMLAAAAFFDMRKREVSDLLWVLFGSAMIPVYVLEFAGGEPFNLFGTAAAIMISGAVSFGIYKSGLFGGADALALVMLAVILPTLGGGIAEKLMPGHNTFLLHSVVPLVVLSNAVIFSLSQIAFNLISNAAYASKNRGKLFEGLEHESMGKKIVAVTIGYRTEISPKFAFPIEQTIDGRRQFIFVPKNTETEEYESRENVWVTRGTPFLAFMLAGFISMLFVGDIAAMVFSTLRLSF